MASSINIEIRNIREIRAAFRMAPRLMAREADRAIRKAVFTIGRQSRINTPVDTGRLRASHYERFSPLRGEVGTNTEYDRFVHDGTRRMRARPYLYRAANQSGDQIDNWFQEGVQKVLNEIGSKT